MQVQIRVFAGLRERAGTDRLTLDLPDGALVADALRELSWLIGGLRTVMAVNREYASEQTPLHADDELALIPPVSGGSAQVHVRISEDAIREETVNALVRDPRAGAVVTFMGVTREVPALEYEGYVEMAISEIVKIAEAAAERHGLCAVAVEHRLGTVPLESASVVIAVSAPHRAEAFDGAREIIDELKLSVPLWKREEGSWLGGALPEAAPSAEADTPS
jgi:MoaE-MoaD fusion protein